MYILGVHGNLGKAEHDSAAVLIKDDQIIAAAEEERFLRYKHAVGVMPDYAIRYCLKEMEISMRDIDVIAFPRSTWKDFRPRFEAYLWYNFGYIPKLEFVDHHLAHAASSFSISGFPSALVLSFDQSGDGVSCGIYRGKGNKIEVVDTIPFPNSLGLFAAFMTQYLGFRSNHDEYKVMGLASYGEPTVNLSNIFTSDKGSLRFNETLLHPEVLKRHPIFHTDQLPMFKNIEYSFLPPRRMKDEPVTNAHKNLAASAQKVIEDSIFELIKKYKEKTDLYLCLAGGVAENSVANGKISESGIFKDIYVSPACNDAGSALGAALVIANKNGFFFDRVENNKWGPSYQDEQILKRLKLYGVKYKENKNIVEDVANLIQKQKIVAWFQGRMEFGPRALGSRSILSDPSSVGMRNRVNRIKKREEFRPFAPSVLSEKVGSLFKTCQESPFMSFTMQTKRTERQKIIAATHIDFTGRPQTVRKDNSEYRKLIEIFYKRTGTPAILNTSLNSSWEPIVESPEQALAFFFSSEIDFLAIGNYIIGK